MVAEIITTIKLVNGTKKAHGNVKEKKEYN